MESKGEVNDMEGRSPMEAGSPEFAEDRTQINSLNNKRIHEEYQDLALTAARRSQVNFDNLQQISLRGLNISVDLQAQINERALKSLDQSQVELASINAQKLRHQDMWAYEQAYDLGNPVATGVGDTVRAGASTQQRGVDTANVQSALNNTTMQTAIEAAVANALNGTIPTLQAAIGAAIAAALVNTPIKPAA